MCRLISTFCCLGLSALLAGCGGARYSGDKRYPLAGEVTFEGEAVDVGSLSLIPKDGKGGPAGGVITAGAYAIPEEKGATAGTYRVEVHWLKRTGKKLRDVESGELYDERREALPDKLHSHSELTVEIPAPDNRHDFQLKAS